MKQKTKKVKILNITYQIKIVDKTDENLVVGDYYRLGTCHKSEEIIYLSNNMNDELFGRVLIHELTHAFIYASGMGQVSWQEENVADFCEAHFQEIYDIYSKLIKEWL